MASNRPTRLPLSGRSPRHLRFELRLKLWLAALAIPALVPAAILTYRETASLLSALLAAAALALAWAIAASILFERVVRPLQTLSNVVAALREDDFSFRARGARRGDSLGDLALEINALAATLQHQRAAALDALTLVELVMTSMPSPVLAFDGASRLRLCNPAAARAFALHPQRSLGGTAASLHLDTLLHPPRQAVFTTASNTARWSVYTTTFRLRGIPHTLFVLADVDAALRQEESLAWQRLIRVLGHEINNSLTPIKSIAGSLRSRLPTTTALPIAGLPDFDRGLAVIEDRADSLNRFLQAYQRLSRLPPPDLRPVALGPLIARVVPLETRLAVHIAPGPEVTLLADPDQLQQLLINLLRNAADAALSHPLNHPPEVLLTWHIAAQHAILGIVDNGPGLTNPANLFVPFYTTKPGGTGIGLILAQQIATAHRGTIRVGNRLDASGCKAEVHLPLAAS